MCRQTHQGGQKGDRFLTLEHRMTSWSGDDSSLKLLDDLFTLDFLLPGEKDTNTCMGVSLQLFQQCTTKDNHFLFNTDWWGKLISSLWPRNKVTRHNVFQMQSKARIIILVWKNQGDGTFSLPLFLNHMLFFQCTAVRSYTPPISTTEPNSPPTTCPTHSFQKCPTSIYTPCRWQLQCLPKHWIIINIWHSLCSKAEVTQWTPDVKTLWQEFLTHLVLI
jgi:hypothetical protein